MKQALVRHTDFLASGWGGGETGVPVYKTIECLQVTFCLFTSFPSILRQTIQYLNCWFFSNTVLNKAKGLVSSSLLNVYSKTLALARGIGLIP